jgi:hypothetical protein
LNKPVGQGIESPDADSPHTESTEEIPFVPMNTINTKREIQVDSFNPPPPLGLGVFGDTTQAFDELLNSDGFFEEMNRAASDKFMPPDNLEQTEMAVTGDSNNDFSLNNIYNLMCGFPGPIIESNSHLDAIRHQPDIIPKNTPLRKRTSGSSLLTLESVIEEVISSMKFHSIRDRLEIPQATLSLSPEEIEQFDSHTRAGVTSLAVRAFLKSTYLGGYTRVMV